MQRIGKDTKHTFILAIAVIMVATTLFILFSAEVHAGEKYHLSRKKLTIYLGEEGGFLELLKSKGGYAKGKTKWKISDPTVLYGESALKNKHFDFTPLKTGSCTVTCTNNGKKYKCKVKVKSYKKKVKVLATVKDAKGNQTQLVRVQNCTKKKKSVYAVEKGEYFGEYWMSVPAKKYAYFLVDNIDNYYFSVLPVGRVNSFIMTACEPTRNVSSKVKVTITIKKNNKYVIKYNNKSSDYVDAEVIYLFYNKDGKVIDMDADSKSLSPHKKKTSKTYTSKAEDIIVKCKKYVYAVSF